MEEGRGPASCAAVADATTSDPTTAADAGALWIN